MHRSDASAYPPHHSAAGLQCYSRRNKCPILRSSRPVLFSAQTTVSRKQRVSAYRAQAPGRTLERISLARKTSDAESRNARSIVLYSAFGNVLFTFNNCAQLLYSAMLVGGCCEGYLHIPDPGGQPLMLVPLHSYSRSRPECKTDTQGVPAFKIPPNSNAKTT